MYPGISLNSLLIQVLASSDVAFCCFFFFFFFFTIQQYTIYNKTSATSKSRRRRNFFSAIITIIIATTFRSCFQDTLCSLSLSVSLSLKSYCQRYVVLFCLSRLPWSFYRMGFQYFCCLALYWLHMYVCLSIYERMRQQHFFLDFFFLPIRCKFTHCKHFPKKKNPKLYGCV